MNHKKVNFIVYLGVFLLLTGASYYVFNRFIPASSRSSSLNSPKSNDTNSADNQQKTGTIQFSGPKTEACPLNGALYTKDEKNLWSQRRPLLAMIENQIDSRPQSGLQSADVVYEAIAEGGITRFMGVFYCAAAGGIPTVNNNKYDIGPIRSARTYYVNLASEYGDYPLYNHVGGANCSGAENTSSKYKGPCTTDKRVQALEQIASYGWNTAGTLSDMNQFSLSYKACRREPDRTGTEKATEHTMYCSTSELWNIAKSRGLTNVTVAKNNVSWDKSFKAWNATQTDKAASNPNATDISFDFWSGYKEYSVEWKYNADKNSYARFNGGQPYVDFNTSSQLLTKNVVVEFTKETRSLDEHLHNLYDVIGTGTGILFQNGTATEITWSKASRTARTIFKDKSGREVNFVPGQIWIEILPIGSKVNYEGSV